MVTIKEKVLAQLLINPDISLKDCQIVVEGLKKDNFYKIKRERNKPKKKGKQGKQKKSQHGEKASRPNKNGEIPGSSPGQGTIKYNGKDLNKFILEKLIDISEKTNDIRAIATLMNFSKETGQLRDYKSQAKEDILTSFKLMDFRTLSQSNKLLTNTLLGNLSIDELKEKLLTSKTS